MRPRQLLEWDSFSALLGPARTARQARGKVLCLCTAFQPRVRQGADRGDQLLTFGNVGRDPVVVSIVGLDAEVGRKDEPTRIDVTLQRRDHVGPRANSIFCGWCYQ